MYFRLLSALFIVCYSSHVAAFSGSFVARKPMISTKLRGKSNFKSTAPAYASRTAAVGIYMRDASASYWFQVGDSVRVVADDVLKAGINLHNRVGTVVETWEKCDVDPTCCCAEQVDINMAVRVEFPGTESDPTAVGTSFLHYFAEAELLKEENKPEPLPEKTNSLPFDGMSCVAFKMDHLQSASQAPRGIASWEPEAQTLTASQEQVENPATSVPFDGMSCVAFKMEKIQSASQQPRGIAAWEPVSSNEAEQEEK